jgi:hypothetical protein
MEALNQKMGEPMNRQKRYWGLGLWLGIVLLTISIALLPNVAKASPPSTPANPAAVAIVSPSPPDPIEAADESFEFQGQPINPRAVAELLPWLSDWLPGPVAMDVAGSTADTNRYLAEVSTVTAGPGAGTVVATWQPWVDHDITYRSGYRWLGRLDNGLHVLRVWRTTGGVGSFTYVLLVQFRSDVEYLPQPNISRRRLMMVRVGEMSLGDRDGRTITLAGNQVIVDSDRDNRSPMVMDVSDYAAPSC